MEEIIIGIYAPGRIGDIYRSDNTINSVSDIFVRLLLSLAIPALGLGWVILYATGGASGFFLSFQYNQPVDLEIFSISPYIFVVAVGGLLIMAFWLLPSIIFFVVALLLPANRSNRGEGFFKRYLMATMAPWSVYYVLLLVAFWTMTTGAKLFYGMRTGADIVFTITLAACVIWQLIATAIVTKNYFTEGWQPALGAFVGITTLIASLLLVTVF